MSFLNTLLKLLEKNTTTTEEIPKGVCPNCWGREEYGGQFYKAVKNNKTGINTKNSNLGWIQEYANNVLPKIQLHQQDEEWICRNCKIAYQPA